VTISPLAKCRPNFGGKAQIGAEKADARLRYT